MRCVTIKSVLFAFSCSTYTLHLILIISLSLFLSDLVCFCCSRTHLSTIQSNCVISFGFFLKFDLINHRCHFKFKECFKFPFPYKATNFDNDLLRAFGLGVWAIGRKWRCQREGGRKKKGRNWKERTIEKRLSNTSSFRH